MIQLIFWIFFSAKDSEHPFEKTFFKAPKEIKFPKNKSVYKQ
jgi:hypothetical protein